MKRGTVLYASDTSDDAASEARAYIRQHGLTRDDVKLVRREDQILVIAEREVRL
jgi:hypothetical protein